MGRDNSPKERQRQQLERKKQGRRARCDRILIVSEGSKTEPLYFDEIRIESRLPAANIAVSPSELGTEPIQVVQYAQSLFEKGVTLINVLSRVLSSRSMRYSTVTTTNLLQRTTIRRISGQKAQE